MQDIPSFAALSDTDLRAAVAQSAAAERAATARLVAMLAEYDRRRLYLGDGYSSLFQFCVVGLHLSESAAFTRIQAARASRKWPKVLQALLDGSVTLTAVGLLAPHFTDENVAALLTEARHQRKSAIERIVARLAPKPDAPSLVRRLPPRAVADPRPAIAASSEVQTVPSIPPPAGSPPQASMIVPAPAPAPARTHAPLAPLSPDRYKLQVTIDEDTRDVLRQAQDLMRHTLPGGDPAVIVARALRLLVDDLLRKKTAATVHPRAARGIGDGSRAIPAAVKRAVWTRDGGRCTFEGLRGRCHARSPLEYHHVAPYAMGGSATADNIELRCRAHNAYQAHLDGLGWQRAPGGEGAQPR